MKQKLAHLANKSDCTIYRNHPDYEASAVVVDCDGNVLFRLDEEFTDEMIWSVLAIANRIHQQAYNNGRVSLAREFHRLFDIAIAGDINDLRDALGM